MLGVVLAAGAGTRLKPLTDARSKAMMPVVGVPMVERVMLDLAAGGVEDFVVVVHPADAEIARHFASESAFRSRVRLVVQPRPAGMADAVACAAPLVDGDFVVAACDNLVEEDAVARLIDLWREAESPTAMLTVMPVDDEDISRTGIVGLDGEWVTRIVEKPSLEAAPSNLASLPLYVFSPAVLRYLDDVPLSARGERELQSAIQMLIEREGRVRAFHVRGRMDLTSAADLLAINRRYLASDGPFKLPEGVAIAPDARFIQPVCVEPGVSVGRGCVVGPYVYAERGCRIEDVATVRDSVLLRGSSVPRGSALANDVLHG
jgi:NDP-sugar pyrophosphorylase family protein